MRPSINLVESSFSPLRLCRNLNHVYTVDMTKLEAGNRRNELSLLGQCRDRIWRRRSWVSSEPGQGQLGVAVCFGIVLQERPSFYARHRFMLCVLDRFRADAVLLE